MGGDGVVKLLGAWFSPFVARVVWALKLKGVEYEYMEEDITKKSPLLLECNPIHKKVPVLIHDGNPIVESLIIVEYIDGVWKEKEPILLDDPYQRTMARFWSKFADEKFLSSLWAAFMSDGEERGKAMDAAEEALKILEKELEGNKFFGGDKLGLVDLTMGWAAHWLAPMEEAAGGAKLLDLHKFPNFSRWMDNFVNHPVIKDYLPAQDELSPFFKNFREFALASK